MPSGKPRRHKPNQGGRPSNQQSGTGSRAARAVAVDSLREENLQLRQLVTHRKLKTDLWRALHEIVELVAFLDDEATPARSTTWDSTSHSASTAILPGVQTPQRDGDRKFRHAGTQAADLEKWVVKMLEWIPKEAQYRLDGVQPVVRPTAPKRIRVKDSDNETAHG